MTGFRVLVVCIACIACSTMLVDGFQVSTASLNRIVFRNSCSLTHSMRRANFCSPRAVTSTTQATKMTADQDISGVAVILLAGGVGSRMKADRPKQFLELEGKPILFHSLDLFLTLSGIVSITVVIAEEYRDMFLDLKARESRLRFASPGKERQVNRPLDISTHGAAAHQRLAGLRLQRPADHSRRRSARLHPRRRAAARHGGRGAGRPARRRGARRGGAWRAVQGHRQGERRRPLCPPHHRPLPPLGGPHPAGWRSSALAPFRELNQRQRVMRESGRKVIENEIVRRWGRKE